MTTRFDVGLDPSQPIVEGDDRTLGFTLATDIGGTPLNLTTAAVLTYAVYDEDPEINSALTPRFTYGLNTGITWINEEQRIGAVALAGADTSGLAGDRFHRLTVELDGATQRAFVGTMRFREKSS